MGRIYIQDWLALKPYPKQVATDSYYLKLSNEIKTILIRDKYLLPEMDICESDLNILSCFLSSYFEDVISETNIWGAFISYHKKSYGKYLPFYDTTNYFENEINQQDIAFLIWYYFNIIQEDIFFNPYALNVEVLANKIMALFERDYEHAPENDNLKLFYYVDPYEKDYYKVRSVIDKLLFSTYLFHLDTAKRLFDKEFNIIKNTEKEDVTIVLQDNRDNCVHNYRTRLLGLHGKDWISEILPAEHPLKEYIKNMSRRIGGYFLYKGQDEKDIFIEHIASGKPFSITKESFDNYKTLNQIDAVLFMGIVNWKNEWWFSGVFFQMDFNADLILDEKNSIERRMDVNFLDYDKGKTQSTLKLQLNAFKEFNNNLPIAFMPATEIEVFIKNYLDYFNNSLNLSNEEKSKAIERTKQDGFLGDNEPTILDLSEDNEEGLVFFNPKSGVEVAMEINSAFPLKENLFFDKNKSFDHIKSLLMSENTSTELAMYCIENFKDDLQFFNGKTGKKYLKDIDFLLRFWKREHYHTIPSITLIGKED